MRLRTFGFDVGTTSVGFAAIDIDETNQLGSILRLGVRIFPEARDPDGTPLNQQRRMKRMMRRQLRRRKERRRGLNELLADAGLLPSFSSPNWNKVMEADPYVLRARGLSETLTLHEIGRALYHLAKRRHFKARDLEEESGAEKGRLLKARRMKKQRSLIGRRLSRRLAAHIPPLGAGWRKSLPENASAASTRPAILSPKSSMFFGILKQRAVRRSSAPH